MMNEGIGGEEDDVDSSMMKKIWGSVTSSAELVLAAVLARIGGSDHVDDKKEKSVAPAITDGVPGAYNVVNPPRRVVQQPRVINLSVLAAASIAEEGSNEKETEPEGNNEPNEMDIMDIVRKRAAMANQELAARDLEQQQGGNRQQGGDVPSVTTPHPHPHPQQPGAYAGAPGRDMERLNKVPFHQISSHGGILQQQQQQQQQSTNAIHQNINSTAPVAAVSDAKAQRNDDNQTTTQQHQDNTSLKADRGPKRKRLPSHVVITTILVIIMIIIALVVVIAVVVVVGKSEEESDDELVLLQGEGNNSPTTNNTNNVVDFGLLLEQVFGVRAGGEGVKDHSLLSLNSVSLLPPETLEAILTGKQQHTNPQQQALEWLSNDPNLSKYGIQQKRQRFVLATIWYSTDGPNWFEDSIINNPWLDYSLHECEWFASMAQQLSFLQEGEPCSNYNYSTTGQYQHADLTSLVLNRNPAYYSDNTTTTTTTTDVGVVVGFPALKGTLPPQVGLLTKLSNIDLGYQKLKGSIPTTLVHLSNTLRRIVLEENFFTGTIPSQVYEFVQILRLNHNPRFDQPEGMIPTSIGRNPRLTHLALVETNRRGPIPTQLYEVTALQQILLADNSLTGILQTQIGKLTSLQHLDINVNQFTGPIPSEIGFLNASLVYLLLGGNRLSGTLPPQLGNLTSMKEFQIKRNQLHGSIPPEIGSMRNITYLDLGYNRLSGTLPTTLSLLSELRYFSTGFNSHINGTIESELLGKYNTATTTTTLEPTWPKLETLDLSSNALTGTIPSEIGLLRSLQSIRLRGNNFGSSLPAELGDLTHLHRLYVEDTNISGVIPAVICSLSLSSLETFRVDCNRVECPEACNCVCS